MRVCGYGEGDYDRRGRERNEKKMKTFLAKVKNRYFDVGCIIK